MGGKTVKSDDEWREQLTPEQSAAPRFDKKQPGPHRRPTAAKNGQAAIEPT